MDYLKYEGSGVLDIAVPYTKALSFDTHGLMARFKVTSGTAYIYNQNKRYGQKNAAYPISEGETFDFVGKIWYYGTTKIEYILLIKRNGKLSPLASCFRGDKDEFQKGGGRCILKNIRLDSAGSGYLCCLRGTAPTVI